jgi:hypothetical protein
LFSQELKKNMGPGKYDTSNNVAQTKQISFNYGKVPFGGCDTRFKDDNMIRASPGPGSYQENKMY